MTLPTFFLKKKKAAEDFENKIKNLESAEPLPPMDFQSKTKITPIRKWPKHAIQSLRMELFPLSKARIRHLASQLGEKE